MITTLNQKFFFVLVAVVLTTLSACPVLADGRFVAHFDNPPGAVSRYDQPDYSFSAALNPLTFPLVSLRMKRKPALKRTSAETSSLTFNTEFYKRGSYAHSLVPVSVDARSFTSYRMRKGTREQFRKVTTRAITNPNRKQQGGGLGIRVALPKRLDRVFGEGGAGLKVTGFRKITFSGRSNWTDAANSDTYQQSKFPSLNMEQISKFDITGTIGSKISVKVSQNSQTDIPLANRIQIRYKGDEDDILKVIEAGNTNLSLPRTALVGYSARVNGLFGIKMAAQVGSLKMTAIASQEKGSADQITITPGGEENATVIRDNEFANGRVFDLGYAGDIGANDKIINLIIYEEMRDQTKIGERDGIAEFMVDPRNPGSYQGEGIKGIMVKEIDRRNFEWEDDPDRNLHYVVFNSEKGRSLWLGAYIQVQKENGETYDIGDLTYGAGDSVSLRILRHPNPISTHQSWKLMWRNCYNVARGMDLEDLKLTVLKGLPGSELTTNVYDYQDMGGLTQNYLEILGLDQYNSADQRFPDGRIDNRNEIYRKDWGLIIFPHREPFNTTETFTDSVGNETQQLQVLVPEIYQSTSTSSAQQDNSQYFLRISTKTRGSIIRLNRANIIEGSERVTANGKALTKGADYTIDYSFGQINLISPEALDPNSELAVDFEYAPFLAIQKKTLLGLRTEYEYSKNFKFGATVLYKSDKAQDRKPRVGQETAKALVYDFDASLTLRPSFITKMVDALPLIETEAPSSFTISGEIAQSHPNPNVEGIAYVDDFESALDQLSLRTSRTSWTKSSKPATLGDDYQRGKLLWHTPRTLVKVDDVWDREAAQGQGTVRTFRMIFRPRHVETVIKVDDNDQIQIDTTRSGLPSWAGIMRSFYGVDPKRAQLLEVRARARSGKLHFDFGRISEDVNGNGFAESEDGITSGSQNGMVEEDEDVGLDGIADEDESDYYQQIKHIIPDPAGDNWYFEDKGKCPLPAGQCNNIDWDDEAIRYEWLNGTEGNINDPSVQGRPDQEVLTSGLKTTNSYFSYVLDFESDSFKVPKSNWPPDVGEDRQWWTYRIPIRDSTALDTTVDDGNTMPQWEDVQHVRVWFEDDSMDDDSWDTVEVAAWYFVQSNWQDSVISPEAEPLTRFVVASVSTEDGTFKPPSGVEAYEDPTTNVTEAQRGLLLQFQNLNNIDTCLAVKEMISVDQYSGYRGMEMFVYGDPSLGPQPDIRFFFRIGANADNFYEYRTSIDTGWSSGNHVKFDFDGLTGFKDSLIRKSPKGQQHNIDDSNSVYRIKGRPNLNEIRYFAAGIVNTSPSDTTLSGFIWLDELRVTGVRKDVGTAGRLSVSGSLADLLTYSFNFDSRDPFFRPISSATRGGGQNNLGSGKTSTSYRYSLTLQAHRFLPRSWGANMPIGYTYSKRTSTPLLRTGTDIILPEEVRHEEQDFDESRSFTFRESFRHKGKNLLFDILLNRISNNVTYGRKTSKRVAQPYSFSENFGVSSNLDMSIKGIPRPPILFWAKPIPVLKRFSDITLGLYPSSWKLSGSFNRSISITDDPNNNRRSTYKRDFGGRMDISYNLFDNLKSTFNFSTKRDLSDHDLVNLSLNDFRLGLETSFSQSFKTSYEPKLFSFFTHAFGYQSGYSDNWDRGLEARHTKMSRSWTVKGRFDHIALFGGKATGGERRFTGRRRTTPQGAKKKEPEEKEEKRRPIYDYPLALMRFLTGWIKTPTYSYGQSYNSSVPGTLERPWWRYRYGLERTTDVPVVSQSRSASAGEGINYNASSGFSLLGGISCDVAFKRTINRDVIKQGSRKETISTSWPDLKIRISAFKTLPLLKPIVNRLIEIFAPRTGFSRSTKETVDLDGGFTTNKSVSTRYNPLLSVNFKVFRNLSLNGSAAMSSDESQKFNLSDGSSQSKSRSSNRSLAFDTKYSFKAPGGIGIPLFGRLKFQSQVSITLIVKFNASKSETSSSGRPWVASADKSDFTWSAVIGYSFSRQIKGGLSTRWQDSSDNYRNQRRHMREISIWTEIRF